MQNGEGLTYEESMANVGMTMDRRGSCVACKFLKKKCADNCIWAPHLSYPEGDADFVALCKVFGASNASKLLSSVPLQKRDETVATMIYEARARIKYPVYGCLAYICALQEKILNLQAELALVKAKTAIMSSASYIKVDQNEMAPDASDGVLPFNDDQFNPINGSELSELFNGSELSGLFHSTSSPWDQIIDQENSHSSFSARPPKLNKVEDLMTACPKHQDPQ